MAWRWCTSFKPMWRRLSSTRALESYVAQFVVEISPRQVPVLPLALALRFFLRRSAKWRRTLVRAQRRFTPHIYDDLFDRYTRALVVGSTPGWRYDRYLLRQAAARSVRPASRVGGWGNPGSYSLPGAGRGGYHCWV